jgi:hypothetical protein
MMIEVPFVPKSPDGILRVIIPGRISTPLQDMNSIAASQADNETWLKGHYQGEFEIRRVGEQASGWLVDRPAMEIAQKRIVAGVVDVVLMAEIRELYRNPALIWAFAYRCVDHDTRFIAHWDNVDTSVEGWETNLHIAVLKHGIMVPEVKRRVRRKATDTFARGGMVMKTKFAYRKLTPEEAATGEFGPVGLRIAKVGDWTPIIREMRRRILAGHTDRMVAQWLNDSGIPPGPYATTGKWTGRLVRDFLNDPLLSGQRTFRKSLSRMYYGSGKYKAQKNPAPLQEERNADLAHFSVEEHESLLAHYAARRERNRGRQLKGSSSPLWNQPRDVSLWPGQSLTCGACGSVFYQVGAVMKCRNALPAGLQTCWNHVVVRTEAVREKVLPLLVQALEAQPAAADMVAEQAWVEYLRRRKAWSASRGDSARDLAQVERKIALRLRLLDQEAEEKGLESVAQELVALEKKKKLLVAEVQKDSAEFEWGDYDSAEAICADLLGIVSLMSRSSRELALMLKQAMPVCRVVPVQAFDCPQVRPRLVVEIRIPGLDEFGQAAPTSIDLFDPPLHIAHALRCSEAKRKHPELTLRGLAPVLELNYMTVKRSIDYALRMARAGVDDPYRVLTERPVTASRWKKRS